MEKPYERDLIDSLSYLEYVKKDYVYIKKRPVKEKYKWI